MVDHFWARLWDAKIVCVLCCVCVVCVLCCVVLCCVVLCCVVLCCVVLCCVVLCCVVCERVCSLLSFLTLWIGTVVPTSSLCSLTTISTHTLKPSTGACQGCHRVHTFLSPSHNSLSSQPITDLLFTSQVAGKRKVMCWLTMSGFGRKGLEQSD